MLKEKGLTLLELLLVLVVIAIIVTLSIRHYRDYHRRIQMAGVKNDIVSVQQALNRYYHTVGCYRRDGKFVGNRSPSLAVLGLLLPGRPPVVPLSANAYSAKIVEASENTAEKKPLYELQVQAVFNAAYSSKRMQWYQKRLGAGRLTGHTLTWTSLPDNQVTAPGTKLWVLKSAGEQFRQLENKNMKNEPSIPTSSSFCSH